MRGLANRVALVSGAARGIGAAIATRLAEEGARVVIGDVLDSEGKATAEAIGETARFVPLDVTSEDDWAHAVALAEREFDELDVLVNNAGILSMAELEETSREDYERLVDVNQTGVFLGMRAAIPALKRAAGAGAIVNISSVEGMGGGPFLTGYTATKFAVRGMTKAAAIELGRSGIRVNSVHPGAIKTDMVDGFTGGNPEADEWMGKKVALKRMGRPEEVAALVAFLASDDASYCTGGEYTVDGGATATSGFGA